MISRTRRAHSTAAMYWRLTAGFSAMPAVTSCHERRIDLRVVGQQPLEFGLPKQAGSSGQQNPARFEAAECSRYEPATRRVEWLPLNLWFASWRSQAGVAADHRPARALGDGEGELDGTARRPQFAPG